MLSGGSSPGSLSSLCRLVVCLFPETMAPSSAKMVDSISMLSDKNSMARGVAQEKPDFSGSSTTAMFSR